MKILCPIVNETLRVPHGFFTRQGGVSTGLYASLNTGLGSDDARDAVLENRDCVRKHLHADRLVTGHQTHSTITALVADDADNNNAPKADALVSTTAGVAIGVLTADCVPVLLADAENGVIGAAHAGWRGAHDGIIASVVETMQSVGAHHIRAVVGPAISADAYEVGPEFVARFGDTYGDDGDLFTAARGEHALFDLPQFVMRQLERSHVDAANLNHCTYGEADLFFSYRRATHDKEADYGRQISAICLSKI